MSELKELKAGDVVSVWDSVFWEWTAERITKLHAENEFETVSSFLYSHDYGFLWQHGIHESLIPQGYAIVPVDELEENKKAFEFNQANFMQQMAKFDKQKEELELAQKEIGELKNNVMVFRDEKNLAIKRWSELSKEKGQLHDLLNAAHVEISRLNAKLK